MTGESYTNVVVAAPWPGAARGIEPRAFETRAVAGRGCYIGSLGSTMRDFAVYRGFTATLLALGTILADTPTARAQAPAPAGQVEGPSQPGTAQLATGGPRRPPRPPLDPARRALRQSRGILAGGVVLTALCGVGFGLATYAIVDAGGRLQGASGGRVIGASVALLACTLVSIAGIGVGASELRAQRRAGRVAWSGGLGLRF